MTFLESIYADPEPEDVNAVYEIIRHVENLILAAKYEELDQLLQSLDATKLNEDTITAFLCSTLPVAQHLPSRLSFLDRAEARLITLIGLEATTLSLDNLRGSEDNDEAQQALDEFMGPIPDPLPKDLSGISPVEAKERLQMILPHLYTSARKAKEKNPEGMVGLAVVSKNQDGTGNIISTFEADTFLADLRAILTG